MSVQTNVQLNADQLQAALPGGAAFSCVGVLASPTQKTITFHGCDDATGQAAITTAAGQFVDRAANSDSLRQRMQQVLAANAAYLGLASPSAAQTAAQVQRNTKAITALIRITLGQLDDVSGT